MAPWPTVPTTVRPWAHIYLTHDAPLDVQLAAGNNQTLASVIDAPPAGVRQRLPARQPLRPGPFKPLLPSIPARILQGITFG